jgi:hypothetical protein
MRFGFYHPVHNTKLYKFGLIPFPLFDLTPKKMAQLKMCFFDRIKIGV